MATITKQTTINYLVKQGHNIEEATKSVNKHFDGYMSRHPHPETLTLKKLAKVLMMWG
jgi:hypothetical protein